ncbi:hypothetical protein Pth03_09030 [Planotetraspora thailandica]|uniref:Non-specific serine/threonine protein kinase n=2 Tax=Planotetraspora thailandica TaxID=487172 RepID=A0A8J3V1V7_9ACTN|nr:hypothetical protein Pth03_09030 [Planotetraspora thailandica]
MAEPLVDGDPSRLGEFEIVGRLGVGSQGVVYLGRSPEGGEVAVKLLHPGLSGDTEARGRFLREVAVAQRVVRFCTAPVLHADLAGQQPYIVSEYVSGPSLRELVEREGPRRGAALDRLAISTATALASIHRVGITHRDFKPANVLMGPEGPVVIDFGIARALDAPNLTATGAGLGTPSYAAPEQVRGASATPAADMFAWGVTMVFAATGTPAFGADTVPAVFHRILNDEPDLSTLDEGPLRDLIAACLAKDPESRPTAEEVLAHLTDPKSSVAPKYSVGLEVRAGQTLRGAKNMHWESAHGPTRERQAPRRRRWGRLILPVALSMVGLVVGGIVGGTIIAASSTEEATAVGMSAEADQTAQPHPSAGQSPAKSLRGTARPTAAPRSRRGDEGAGTPTPRIRQGATRPASGQEGRSVPATTPTLAKPSLPPISTKVEAEAFASESGTLRADHPGASGGATVGYIDSGDWTGYASVTTQRAIKFSARVASTGVGGTITIRSGSPTGTAVGSVQVPKTTGSWDTFQTVSTELTGSASGQVFLVFTGEVGIGSLFDVDSFTITRRR